MTTLPNGRVGYLIGFGTGRYLANSDNTSNGANGQGVYTVWDKLVDGPVIPLTQLQQQRIVESRAVAGTEFRLTSHAVGIPTDTLLVGIDGVIPTLAEYYATKRGWYVNLPTSGERAVSNVAFRNGRLALTSMIPDASSPCAYGGSGWLLDFDAFTGNRPGKPTLDLNGDNTFDSGDFLGFTATGSGKAIVSGTRLDGIPAEATRVRVGKNEVSIVGTTKDKSDNNNNNVGSGQVCTVSDDGSRVCRPCIEGDSNEVCLNPTRGSPFGRAMWRDVR